MHLEPIVRRYITNRFIGRQREIKLAEFEQEGLTPAILLESQAEQQFAVSQDFTSCRSEFFPDPGGRGFESPVSAQERCFARLHEGRDIEPTGFTAERPVAGGTLSQVIRATVPAVLTVGATVFGGTLIQAAVGRATAIRPPSTVPLDPPPEPEPQPIRTDRVFDFIRRNGIFLALGLGLFAFLRSP